MMLRILRLVCSLLLLLLPLPLLRLLLLRG